MRGADCPVSLVTKHPCKAGNTSHGKREPAAYSGFQRTNTQRIWSNDVAIEQPAGSDPVSHRFLVEEAGVTAIEYGLLASLIAVACIAAFKATGPRSTSTTRGAAPAAARQRA